jgi:glycosyltransferase involved in cell wall biosynthesis
MLSERLRLGYVVKRFPRYSETFVVTEILAHESAGWEVEIFSLRPPVDTHFQDSLSRLRAPVRYLPSEGLKAVDLWAALQRAIAVLPEATRALEEATGEDALTVHQALVLAREVRERRIDHLQAHFATSATAVARIAACAAEVPYSFTAHAKDIFHETVRPDDLRKKLEQAAAVVTVSEFNVAHLRTTFGAAASRVRRIYNGLDLERFPYTEPRSRAARVVSVGRLVEKKGFDVLLDAAALLAARGAQFSVEIIGGGELEETLRRRVDELGLRDRVRLPGPRPQAEIAAAVAQAAAFAAPCVVGRDGNRDGLPTTLLEAMALGTPCVSTDVTGIPELVRDGETGLLVPQNDPAALAEALARLLDDAELRVALAARARRRIEVDFDARRNSERLRQLFLDAHATRSGAVLPVAKAV